MHPVLFNAKPFTVYTYGFFIAVGAVLGFAYMARQARKQFGTTFDQSNTLFILLVLAGVAGGKAFLIFESPSAYIAHPSKLLSGSGFVFYGSLLFCIPTMIWYFRRVNIPTPAMLDVMAIVTCVVHGFGRIGCFMAGCCYGLPTDFGLAVVFTSPACQARPLNTPLHPTQLYEATLIFVILGLLLVMKPVKRFHGQLFLVYLIAYAAGRGVIEVFRGDTTRGFLVKDVLSISQFTSLIVIGVAVVLYAKRLRKANLAGTSSN